MSDPTDPLSWVARAEEDYSLAQSALRRRKPLAYGAVFHAQQCAEKYLKGRLSEAGISFGKVHDLVALLEVVLAVEAEWEAFREDLAYLSDFAVSFRYPGESAEKDSALDARRRCRKFRDAARKALRLKT